MINISRAPAFLFLLSFLNLHAQGELSPCRKFQDAPDTDKAETNYILYRNFLKEKNREKAFEIWRKVHEVSPAADGRRNTVYADGIRFYEYFISQTRDSAQVDAYVDTIFALYDEVDRCYPEGGYFTARKAFDLYYKYPHRASRMKIYQMFKASIDEDGLGTPDFVLNPISALLVELHKDEQITDTEARYYKEMVLRILQYGLENCKGPACGRWQIIEQYVPSRFEYFETVKGFYPCDYYVSKHYSEFEANPDDCSVIWKVLKHLMRGGCPESDERYRKVFAAMERYCRPEPPLDPNDYPGHIKKLEQAIQTEPDSNKKASYALTIAKIYNVHHRNFPRSREWALQAAALRPHWGEPFLLIGRLYASSGALCGSGQDWNSVRVVLPALDMWEKAKLMDPTFAAEAERWISRYRQYLPTKEMMEAQNLKVGDTYFVDCWIQETTTIRARAEE